MLATPMIPLPQKRAHFSMVLGAVLEAHERGSAHGVAHEHGREDHHGVHDDAVGRHAVLADEAQKLPVV